MRVRHSLLFGSNGWCIAATCVPEILGSLPYSDVSFTKFVPEIRTYSPSPPQRKSSCNISYDVTPTRQHAGIDYVPHGRFARLRKTKLMKDMTVIVRIRFRIFGLKITTFVMQFHFFLFFLFFRAAGMLYNYSRSCTLPKKNGRPREQVYMRTGVYGVFYHFVDLQRPINGVSDF